MKLQSELSRHYLHQPSYQSQRKQFLPRSHQPSCQMRTFLQNCQKTKGFPQKLLQGQEDYRLIFPLKSQMDAGWQQRLS
ncbi:MAG: hypothetical protein CMO47_00685 [Verrucomicrobiales bacterium]|nr:hypothetical protein [Verrucomicrobiales bacterium]